MRTLPEAIQPEPWGGKPHPAEVRAIDRLGSRIESMIAIQCEAYPCDWSLSDKREMAELHLFGRERVS